LKPTSEATFREYSSELNPETALCIDIRSTKMREDR